MYLPNQRKLLWLIKTKHSHLHFRCREILWYYETNARPRVRKSISSVDCTSISSIWLRLPARVDLNTRRTCVVFALLDARDNRPCCGYRFGESAWCAQEVACKSGTRLAISVCALYLLRLKAHSLFVRCREHLINKAPATCDRGDCQPVAGCR